MDRLSAQPHGMLPFGKFFLMSVILAAVSLACVTQGSAQAYPNVGNYPIPMQPNPPGTTFPYQDPLSGGAYNPDGTNSLNPVISAGTQTVSSVTYNLQTLTNNISITFKGQNYTVYSAVPQNMTVANAYTNPTPFYDPTSLTNIDFTIPSTINGGNPTALATNQPPTAPTASPYTQEQVYLTTPPTHQNSRYFVPNLPNTSNHNGLTANIYFVGDSYIGKPGYAPDTSTYPNGAPHLTPYGWASDPRYVNMSYQINLLDSTGGGSTGTTTVTAQNPVNYWKHSIQGVDTFPTDIATQIMQGVQADANYPFPPGTPANYLNWLVTYNQSTNTYTMNGVYMHVQPQPGFQRNLLRYYTAWGAVDIYNQSSDLFVRADGTIELPAVQNASGAWQYAPIVAQTWDGSQRYTLLNQTKSQVPSTYDDYPGYEYYLPGNVYLPGQAGVVTGYLNYLVWDSTGALDYRQTDQWLGLKGDGVNDVSTWAYAPVSGQLTEPGGQGNKPYMFGAGNNASGQYLLRLQASNSFGVARLLSTDLQGKLYDASFYANFNNGKGYQKAATISYQWQPWTIGGSSQATWNPSTDSYGAGVAQLTYANTLAGQVAITADQSSWNAGAMTLPWETVQQVDPSQLSTYASTLNNPIWGNYTIVGTGTDANTQFLIVLNPMAYFTPSAGGDWGTAANWSSGAVPDDNHNVYLLQGGTVTYNNTSPTAPPLSMLQVDGGTILQINTASPTGDLAAEMAIVGAANTGALVQTNGTVTLTDKLYLGYETAANGTYTLQGGTFTAASVQVGVYGTGIFNQSTGTATISDTLTLAANSGSTGTYNLSGGTLNVGTLTQNAGGTFNNTGGTFNGPINLSGGTVNLSSAGSTYSGTHNISGGTLNMSGVGALYTGASNLSGGTLNLSEGTLSGLLTLTGGTFNFSGNGAYINLTPLANPAGTTLNIAPGRTMAIVGGLNNTGTTTVNGTLTGSLTNAAGGLVTGSGIITGAFVNNGTVNPGNSPGTLTVATYTSTPGATQVVEIESASSYDKIVTTAAGGAILTGGTLSPRLLNGYLPSTNTVFNVVQTTGGGTVTGAFDGIDNTRVGNSRTLFWQALYTPTSADLKAVGNYTPPDLALSSNQRSVGNALNSLAPSTTGGDMLTVLDAINALTTDGGVRAAFNEISPAKYAALPTMTMPITHMQFQAMQNRLARERWEAELGSDAVSAGGGGFMRNFNFGYENSTKMLLATSNLTVSDAGTPLIHKGIEQRWAIYLEPMANWGSQSATANLAGYRYKNFGFTLGAEYWVMDNLLVGVNTGYSKTLGSAGGSGGDLNANVIPFNAYGAFFMQGFYANATLGYTYSGYNMERRIAFGTINRTAKASTSGNQFQMGAETGYDAKIGNAVVGPVVSLQYATQTVDGFTESGAGALGLKVGSQSADSVQTGIGARASYKAKIGNVAVKPQLSVTWQHEFSDNTRGLNASLAAGGSTINYRTDKIGQNFALISVDVPAKVTKNLVANIGYTAEVGRDKSTNMGINLGLKYKW